MKSEPSILDPGLAELARATSDSDLLLSGIIAEVETSVGAHLKPEPPMRGTVSRPASAMPADKITIKLLAEPEHVDDMLTGLREMGVDVISGGGKVVLANVEPSELTRLQSVKGLKRAEQAYRMTLCNDVARGEVSRCDIAQATHPHLRGQGVVVGIMDSGTDWRHDDFIDDQGQTRLEMLLHADRPPDSSQDSFTQYSAAQINAALNGSGAVPVGDLDGHGTHVASIAAGNGRASNGVFRGVAPDATLMACRSDTLHDTHSVEAIRRFFRAAGNRPAVINLSLGGHFGAHDGTSALENLIAEESGPGRIVVVAAGNDAAKRIHFDGTLVMGQDLDMRFTMRDANQWLIVWIPRGDEVGFSLVDPDGTVTPLSANGEQQQTQRGAFAALLQEDPVNRDQLLVLSLAVSQIGRRWTLRLTPTKVSQGEVHAWALTRDPRSARNIFMSAPTPRYSIAMPATEERAISVGALVSRNARRPGDPADAGLVGGDLAFFTSQGPGRLGTLRPDIAAPGQFVVAALAGGSALADPSEASNHLPGQPYVSLQGTSMAAPFVAGVVALMLQQNPKLTPEDVQLRLRATAQRDNQTGPVWNSGYGFGKIDVEALLNYPDALTHPKEPHAQHQARAQRPCVGGSGQVAR